MAVTFKTNVKAAPTVEVEKTSGPPPADKKLSVVKMVPKGIPAVGSAAEVLAGIRKDKGDKVVVMGNTIAPVRRLPTGIFEFDFATGGGFPRGRYSIVYGPESSCKTNLALKAVAQAQKLPAPCNKAVWVNIEQTFDPIWAEKMGVNTKELIVVQAGYGEEAVDLTIALVQAEDVALVVADSLAALIASKEIAKSVEEYDVGTTAMLIKRMANKLMIAFGEERKRDHDPCVIFINQIRYKPNTRFGDPETMPGGEAIKFLCSLRVRTSAKNIINTKTGKLVYKETKVVVKKAKVPVRTTSFEFKLCMIAADGLSVGETDSFNGVKVHLQALQLLAKTPKGWALQMGKKSIPFATLSAMEERYLSDGAFSLACQGLVIEQHKDEMILVEEPDTSPKDVQPGTAVDVEVDDGDVSY